MSNHLHAKFDLAMRHQPVPMKPIMAIPNDPVMEEYMRTEHLGGLKHKFERAVKHHTQAYNKHLIGQQSYDHREMDRRAQQHRQEHIKKNMERMAHLRGLQLGNPEYKQMEVEGVDSAVYDKLKNLFIVFTTHIKHGTVNKEAFSPVQEIQNVLLQSGYNLTESEINELLSSCSVSRELLQSRTLREAQDLKDSGIYYSIKSVLKTISDILAQLKPYAEKSLRDRKSIQKGIKAEVEKKLLNEDALRKKFGKSELLISERLAIDDKYASYKQHEKKAEEDARRDMLGEERVDETFMEDVENFSINIRPQLTELLDEYHTNKDEIQSAYDKEMAKYEKVIAMVKGNKQTLLDDGIAPTSAAVVKAQAQIDVAIMNMEAYVRNYDARMLEARNNIGKLILGVLRENRLTEEDFKRMLKRYNQQYPDDAFEITFPLIKQANRGERVVRGLLPEEAAPGGVVEGKEGEIVVADPDAGVAYALVERVDNEDEVIGAVRGEHKEEEGVVLPALPTEKEYIEAFGPIEKYQYTSMFAFLKTIYTDPKDFKDAVGILKSKVSSANVRNLYLAIAKMSYERRKNFFEGIKVEKEYETPEATLPLPAIIFKAKEERKKVKGTVATTLKVNGFSISDLKKLFEPENKKPLREEFLKYGLGHVSLLKLTKRNIEVLYQFALNNDLVPAPSAVAFQAAVEANAREAEAREDIAAERDERDAVARAVGAPVAPAPPVAPRPEAVPKSTWRTVTDAVARAVGAPAPAPAPPAPSSRTWSDVAASPPSPPKSPAPRPVAPAAAAPTPAPASHKKKHHKKGTK